VSLCVQSEGRPDQYVSVEGPAELAEFDLAERPALARRCLGPEGGDQYVADNYGKDAG
jgi:hypothetical protein